MSGFGFEWARICLEQTTGAAGLRVRLGESPSGAPYASFAATEGDRSMAATLEVAEDTLVVRIEIARERDEPSDDELERLDAIAAAWPAGSLAWNRRTRTLLARTFLDAPEGRAPSGSDLRAAVRTLVEAAPRLARLDAPSITMRPTTILAEAFRRFEEAGISLVPIGESVIGQRVRHPLASIGSFGIALGEDVVRTDEGRRLCFGFWIEGELLDGTAWPAGRAGGLLANELRDAIAPGTILRRDDRAVWRASYARVPDGPRWPVRALGAAASAVRDVAETARSGRFDRRAPRPNPG